MSLYLLKRFLMVTKNLNTTFSLFVRLDNDRFSGHVMVDGFDSVLLADATLFKTAEGEFVVDFGGAVDPGVAGFELLGGFAGLVEVAGPDGGA